MFFKRRARRTRAQPMFERLGLRKLLDGAGPVDLTPNSFSVLQNAEFQTLDVLANDRFADAYDGLRRITSISAGSQGGRLRIADDSKTIIYAPPADFAGKEIFTYQVDLDFATEVSVEIVAPLADDSYSFVADGAARQLDLLANDPFPTGYSGAREITLLSETSLGGQISINAGGQSVIYEMPEGVFGKDTFVYIVDDRYPARATIDIPNPLESDSGEFVQNDGTTVFQVLGNDPFWSGYDGPRRVTHLFGNQEGSVAEIVDGGGAVTYQPARDFAGYDSVTYVVDGRFEATLRLTVQRPTRDDSASVDGESREFYINVTANDWYRTTSNDVRDIVDRVTSVNESAEGGVVTISEDGQGVLYTPPAGFRGNDQFEYVADEKYRAVVRVGVSDPVRDDWLTVYRHTENNRLDVLANDFFGNGYTGARKITKVTEPTDGGTLQIAADGQSLTYTPPDDSTTRTEAFEYEVDGDFLTTVQVHIRPIAENDYLRFGQPAEYRLDVLANDHFGLNYLGDGRITGVSLYGSGEVTIIDEGRALLYSGGADGDQITYTVDAQHQAVATIDFPNRLVNDEATISQNGPRSEIDVLANDFESVWIQREWGVYDGPKQITSVTAGDSGGIIEISADGKSIYYTPASDFHGNDRFTYVVDGFLEAQITMHVIRRVRDDRFHVEPDSADNSLSVLINDLFGFDYAGAGSITHVTETTAGGSLSIENDGQSIGYSPPSGFVGQDSFVYTVDGKLKAEVNLLVEDGRTTMFGQFGNLAELESYLIDDAIRRYDYLFASDAPMFEQDASLASDASSGRIHSETNVQVAGVDESDLIETDGDFIYSLHGNSLVISKAWPANELSVVSQTPVRGTPLGELLSGNRLAVISREFEFHPWFDVVSEAVPIDRPAALLGRGFAETSFSLYPPTSSKTIVTVFDVSDRTSPVLVQETEFEGAYVESRRIEETIFLVMESGILALPPPQYQCNDGQCKHETRDEYLARLDSEFEAILATTLPHYSSYGPNGDLARTGLLVQPEDIYRPAALGHRNLVSIASLSLMNSEPGLTGTTGIVASGAAIIHGAFDSLYLFDQRTDWGAEEGSAVDILKFSWDAETGVVEPAAFGSVSGRMLDQFSADEFEGKLRIATTVSNNYSGNFSGRDENVLFVLEDDHGVLEFAGGIKNLALDETIRSVRFFGDRAFVVTFQTVDPLFGVDLSDPTDPRVAGHVTLPGFSEYMQFVTPDHLLTVGRNTPNGFDGPAMVSLMNVADLSHPILVGQSTLPRFSRSEAAADHHAFGWFAPHQVLAVPAVHYYRERLDTDGDGYAETSQLSEVHELYSFRIDTATLERDPEAIRLLGKVEHDSAVRRSAFIDDVLYSVADASIKASEIDDPGTELGSVSVDVSSEPSIRPGDDPHWEWMRDAQQTAMSDFAEDAGTPIGSVLAVTTESSPSGFRMVLRVGDDHRAYSIEGGTLSVLRTENVFAAAGHRVDWHNAANAYDVNNDGVVAPMDVAFIINDLNRWGSRQLQSEFVLRQIDRPHFFFDVTSDGYTSALDVLQLINHINQSRAVTEGEGGSGRVVFVPRSAQDPIESVRRSELPGSNSEIRGHDVSIRPVVEPRAVADRSRAWMTFSETLLPGTIDAVFDDSAFDEKSVWWA